MVSFLNLSHYTKISFKYHVNIFLIIRREKREIILLILCLLPCNSKLKIICPRYMENIFFLFEELFIYFYSCFVALINIAWKISKPIYYLEYKI